MKLLTAIIAAQTAILVALESKAQFLAALRQDDELAKCRAQIDTAITNLNDSIMEASLDYPSVATALRAANARLDKLHAEVEELRREKELRER